MAQDSVLLLIQKIGLETRDTANGTIVLLGNHEMPLDDFFRTVFFILISGSPDDARLAFVVEIKGLSISPERKWFSHSSERYAQCFQQVPHSNSFEVIIEKYGLKSLTRFEDGVVRGKCPGCFNPSGRFEANSATDCYRCPDCGITGGAIEFLQQIVHIHDRHAVVTILKELLQ